ncbi:cytochrome c3 family protein [Oryzomonas sagensis]|nr:cytochrome c3 family protein [Oryzomonas sagensis]
MNRLAAIMTLSVLCSLLAPVFPAGADSILTSPHNLSSSGPGRIKSSEERVCIFCHTPHHATKLTDTSDSGPLWSRDENTAQDYITYVSSTISAKPGQPMGASRLCLSCHDGTIALGSPVAHGTTAQLGVLTPPSFPQKSTVLGKDLRDDHPISMEYGLKTGEFRDPATIAAVSRVKLVSRNGTNYVECSSCHNAHDNQYGNFLVTNTATQADALCTVCHTKNGWSGSAHQTGGTRYGATVATAVSQQGCISCHTPHGAQRGENLLKLTSGTASMDTNCYASCHNNDNGAPYLDMRTAGFHNPAGGGGYDGGGTTHTEAETLPLTAPGKHVHCVDCHNPHQTLWQNAPLNSSTAPNVNGVLTGVRGVTINGAVTTAGASYEYEICLKCHSGDAALAGNFNEYPPVSRMFSSLDERERINWGSAKSWHPIAHQRTGTGNSLLNKGITSIYCNDCHDSHGSGTHLLRLDNQDTFSAAQGTSYPLCYSCHDETYLMNTATDLGKLHKAHVQGLHNPLSSNNTKASCSACHDPHGVPYKAGLTTDTNSLHLINFDLRYAATPQAPNQPYDAGAKTCFVVGPGTSGLTCHTTTTNPASYNPYPYSP